MLIGEDSGLSQVPLNNKGVEDLEAGKCAGVIEMGSRDIE